jgi:transcriptional regulator with XRE-family HTH domain
VIDLPGFIKSKRLEAGLSQAGLARLAGLKDETIMNIENGRTIPRNITINQLANIFNLSEAERQNCIESAKHNRRDRNAFDTKYFLKRSEKYLDRLSKRR